VAKRISNRGCDIPGCEGKHEARGWCGKHYGRWQRTGDPLNPGHHRHGEPEKRFWDKVNKDGPMPEPGSIADQRELGQCWVWTAALNLDGYGYFALTHSQGRAAHRVAYEWEVGPITERTLDHLCRNRACVRPTHLEPATDKVNIQRGLHGLEAKTHCIRNHELTPDNLLPNKKGWRECRECQRERDRGYYYANLEAKRKRVRDYQRRKAAERRARDQTS
jgi:hypothetical protein